MLIGIGISLIAIAITIIIHAIGSAFWIGYQKKKFSATIRGWQVGRGLRILIVFAVFMIFLHFIEIIV